MFFSKSISHHCDGLHGCLEVCILRLHTHNPVIIINLFVRVFVSCSLVLFLNLSLAVEDDIKVFSLWDGLSILLLNLLSV